MKIFMKYIVSCGILATSCVALAVDLKDPHSRDENITNTVLTVDVTQEGELYKYVYTLNSPTENLGIINALTIDISCDLDFGEVDIPVTIERLGHSDTRSVDGNYVPTEVFAAYGTSNLYGITRDNKILWGLFLEPGKSITNIWVLSPAPPAQRTYTLLPYIDNNPEVWDISVSSESDPTIPSIDDFTVTGTIAAPACAFAPTPNDDLFEGNGREPFKVNGLLRYSNPTSDPIALDSVNSSIELAIHYAEGIQKQSFSARLDGKDISSLFNPIAGTNEKVTIAGPWNARSRLSLSILGIVDGRIKGVSQDIRPSQSLNTPAQENAAIAFDEFKSKDTDTFHIFVQ